MEFGGFLKELCHDVLEASGASNIVCLVRAEQLVLPPEQTIPLALIVTELVSNALEHGFADRPKGTISIDLARSEDQVSLTVNDDGAGLAPDFELATTRSLGLRIVKQLAAQLGGAFAMSSGEGTTCRVTFPAS